jgi:hypothetical protein
MLIKGCIRPGTRRSGKLMLNAAESGPGGKMIRRCIIEQTLQARLVRSCLAFSNTGSGDGMQVACMQKDKSRKINHLRLPLSGAKGAQGS